MLAYVRSHFLSRNTVVRPCCVLAGIDIQAPIISMRGTFRRAFSAYKPRPIGICTLFSSKLVNEVVGMNVLEQKSAADANSVHKLASKVWGSGM